MSDSRHVLRLLPALAYVAAARLDRLTRGRLPRRLIADADEHWGVHSVSWPVKPFYGQGIYRCRIAIVRLPAGDLARLLPPGLVLGRPAADGLHPVVLFFGRQSDVRPNVSPLPGWTYSESVVAIPDVVARDPRYAYQGPFTYLPRIWLDHVAPLLAGVLMYGYAKRLARIVHDAGSFTVHDRAQNLLGRAEFAPAGDPGRPCDFDAWPDIQRLIDQPILGEPLPDIAPDVAIGSVLSLRSDRVRRLVPLVANVTIAPGAIPGFGGGAFAAAGLGQVPAAFEMESHWRLTPPMPRSWFFPPPPFPPASPQPAPAPDPAAAVWTRPQRRKIAVLGGGVGALTAVWALTRTPDWQELYEITVYQQGWRLGGKGASGRNAKLGQRIEEHGLHIWAGFYENAFRMMRAVYDELGRPAGTPLATLEDAFKPHRLVTLEERVSGAWQSWNIDTPELPGLPGAPAPHVPGSPLHYLTGLFAALARLLDDAPPSLRGALTEHPVRSHAWARTAVAAAQAGGHRSGATEPPPTSSVLGDAHALARHAATPGVHRALQLLAALRLVRAAQTTAALDGLLAAVDTDARRYAELIDLGLATAAGMLADGLVFRGFAAADGEEWRDWLRRHGARPASVDSAVVRATYDYVFGFAGGDPARPALAAGTTTHGVLRLLLTYKGALFWAMQAGMGDTVFTPLYRVLQRRGVRFAFFHRVNRLGLSDDGRQIGRIEMARQAQPADPKTEYCPLVTVNDLECWPSAPLYDRLANGAALAASGADLEHEDGPLAERLVLEHGRDFDGVVLGISLGALPAICGDLAAASPPWRTMLDRVRTVATLGVQLWFERDLAGLGWTGGQTIATAYAEPLDTWADMPWLLPREAWGDGQKPASVIYLCGPLADAEGSGDTAREAAIARGIASAWLSRNAGHLWPAASDAAGALNPAELFAPAGSSPEERLTKQYFRANTRGSERYVQTVPGSTAARLRPGQSGFDNLWLAGDWVRTGMNAGCVEAAAMGGLAAAAAVSHRHIEIVDGEDVPLAATLFEHAADAVHGVAQTTATVVVASLGEAAARALLPDGLDLAAPVLTPDGEVPVLFMVAQHRNARPNFSPLGMNFRELLLLVPATRPAGAGRPFAVPGPYAYAARRFLDNPAALALGRALYGDAGRLARFAAAAGGVTRIAARGGRLLDISARPADARHAAPADRHFARIEWLLGRPLLTGTSARDWRISRIDYGLEHAHIQSITTALVAYPALNLEQSRESRRLVSGERGVIGAFRLWTETSRSNPLLGRRPLRPQRPSD